VFYLYSVVFYLHSVVFYLHSGVFYLLVDSVLFYPHSVVFYLLVDSVVFYLHSVVFYLHSVVFYPHSVVFYLLVDSVLFSHHSVVFYLLVDSVGQALLLRSLSLTGRPVLGRVLVVPNYFHLRMMEATVFLGTFIATQSCLGALRTIPSTSWLVFFSDMHCQLCDLI
jgi:hypothetical protein